MDKLCCKPKKEEPLSATELIEHLESTIHALDVKCKGLSYQCSEHLLRAKKYKQSGEHSRALSEMRIRSDLLSKYDRYVNLFTNVSRIRNSIDETQTVGEVAKHMNVANKVLEEALKNVNPEKIEELMEQLESGTSQIHEVTALLGEDRIGFDEEAALAELEDLPNVPSGRIKKNEREQIHL